MTDETIAQKIEPGDLAKIVEAVSDRLTSGQAGMRIAGLDLEAGALRQSVADAVENALSISLLDAVLKGWRGVKTLADLIGPDGPIDGKPRVAALASHTFKVVYKPNIQISIGEAVALRTIELPVTLEIAAAGVVLTVKDREITKAGAGHLQPKLTIKVEKVKVVDTKLKRINLSEYSVKPAPATPELVTD